MATEIEQLVVSLEARIRDFERNFQRASRTASNSFSQIERRAEQSAAKMQASLRNSAANINGILGAIGVGVGLNEITRLADGYTRFTNQLRVAGREGEAMVQTQNKLFAIAQKYGVELEAVGTLYGRNAAAAKEMGLSEAQQLRIVEATSAALKVSGQSAQSASGALLQLSQALGGPVIQAQEYNSLLDGARPLLQVVANGSDRWGGSVAKLTADVKDGTVATSEFVQALLKGSEGVIGQAAQSTLTFSGAITVLTNSLTKYVGEMNEASGIGSVFTNAIVGAANNMPAMAEAAAAAAAVISSRYVPGLARAALAQTAMVATNPFLLLATVVGGATFALAAFGDEIHPVQGEMSTLQDYAAVAWQDIKAGAADAASTASTAFVNLANLISNAMGGGKVSMADLAAFAKEVANNLIGAFGLVYDTIVISFSKLPGAIAEVVLKTINGLIAAVENGLNFVVSGINAVIDAANSAGASLEHVGNLNLGRIKNDFAGAGAEAGKAYVEALRNATKDHIGNILSGLRERANAHAKLTPQGNGKTEPYGPPAPPQTPPKADKEAKLNDFQREVQSLKERTALLLVEANARRTATGSLEEQEAAVEKARIAYELLQAAEKSGVKITAEVSSNIDRLADAYVSASEEARRLEKAQHDSARAQERMNDQLNELNTTGSDAMKGFVKDLIAGKSPAEALASAIGKISEKLIDLALNQIFDGMFTGFGGSSSGGGGGFGSILGSLFTPGTVQRLSGQNTVLQLRSPAVTSALPTGDALQAASSLPGSGSVSAVVTKAAAGQANQALQVATSMLGKHEIANHADVQSFLKAGGVDLDSAQQKWCAGFVNSSLAQVGIKGSGSQIANSFQAWGKKIDPSQVMAGDVLVKPNGHGAFETGGHVGFATGQSRIGQNGLELQMLSGNASNRVQYDWYNAQQLQVRRAAEQSQQVMQEQMQAQQQLATQMQQTTQATQMMPPPLATMQSGMTGLEGNVASLAGTMGQGVPVVGQFQGALQQMLQSMGGGSGGGGGLFSGIGSLFGFAEGGHVSGPGTATSDSIPALLSNGEFVVNAKATKRHRAALEAINSGRAPAFAKGGFVSSKFASSYSPSVTINMQGQGGNGLARQIAGEVGRTLDQHHPDTFRRSDGQRMAELQLASQRAARRNS